MITLIILFRSVFVQPEPDPIREYPPEPVAEPQADGGHFIEDLDWETSFSEFSSESSEQDQVAVNENTERPSHCQGEKVSLRSMAEMIKWFEENPAA